MLVRRRVVDDIGVIVLHDAVDAVRVPHGGDQHHQIQLGISVFQLLLYLIGIVLIDVNDDQPRRSVPRDLSAQLASDRAAPARHHDRLPPDIVQDRFHINLDRVAPQQILDIDIPKLADIDLAVHELVDAGQRAELAARLLADLDERLHRPAVRRRDRDEDLIDAVQGCVLHDPLTPADDLDPLYEPAPLILVVVDDALDRHRAVGAVRDLLDDRIPGIPCSDDHHARAVFPVLRLVPHAAHDPVGKPCPGRDPREHQRVDKIIAARDRIAQDLHPRKIQDRAQDAGRQDILHLRRPRKCPQTVVQLKDIEHGKRHDHVCDHEIPRRVQVDLRDIPVIQFKADPQRRDARHTHCHDIQYHEHDPSLCQLWIDTIQ